MIIFKIGVRKETFQSTKNIVITFRWLSVTFFSYSVQLVTFCRCVYVKTIYFLIFNCVRVAVVL